MDERRKKEVERRLRDLKRLIDRLGRTPDLTREESLLTLELFRLERAEREEK